MSASRRVSFLVFQMARGRVRRPLRLCGSGSAIAAAMDH